MSDHDIEEAVAAIGGALPDSRRKIRADQDRVVWSNALWSITCQGVPGDWHVVVSLQTVDDDATWRTPIADAQVDGPPNRAAWHAAIMIALGLAEKRMNDAYAAMPCAAPVAKGDT